MKYFTPELYYKYNSTDDDVVDIASNEWEQNCTLYEQELKQLHLSEDVSCFLSLCFHDATVPSIVEDGMTFTISLIPEYEKPGKIVYDLIKPPTYQEHAFLKNSYPKMWLYDEIGEGFTHSILFSDGSEINIYFSNIRWISDDSNS